MNRVFYNFRIIPNFSPIKCVHTGFMVCYKKRGAVRDPGVTRRAQIFKDDDKFIQNLEDEEDIASLESDFHQSHLSYSEHKRQKRYQKIKVDRIVTKKKFFAEEPLPGMLTWAERLQIKKLHSEDSLTWSLDVLADSFPATREVISKVLKQKWQPDNLNKLKRMDAKVHENWRLLAEGKLEADEEFLENIRKFLPRREDHLKALAVGDIRELLPAPKSKPVWNNGQMSGILESYEKALDALENQKTVLICDSSQNEPPEIKTEIPAVQTNLTEKTDDCLVEKIVISATDRQTPATVEKTKPDISTKIILQETEARNEEPDLEEKSIEDTFFWPSASPKQVPMTTTETRVPQKRGYPERIKIPKHQKNSGLTFKVGDCFYDDDGEFLYRVPGMSSSKDS